MVFQMLPEQNLIFCCFKPKQGRVKKTFPSFTQILTATNSPHKELLNYHTICIIFPLTQFLRENGNMTWPIFPRKFLFLHSNLWNTFQTGAMASGQRMNMVALHWQRTGRAAGGARGD